MNVIVIGDRSDIIRQMRPMMAEDDWHVEGWNRDSDHIPELAWDLVIVAVGRVAPVCKWWEATQHEWEHTIDSNVLLPVRMLRKLWALRKPNAAVCFMAGANPNKPMENYSAYSVGKMALLKACEHLDLESPDCKFFALAPGVVLTKIHEATIKSGVKNERLERAINEGDVVPVERIYACLKWCLAQPKEVIGGRNICTSDQWEVSELVDWLREYPTLWKLRRQEEIEF